MIGAYSLWIGGMALKRRILLFIALCLLPACAMSETSDYVRLHVIAADDTPQAQSLKLKVRDAVLECARPLLEDAPDANAAWDIVRAQSGTLLEAAAQCARANGYDGPVACQTGVFPFPDRQYGGITVPAGDYRALRVVIGAGQGRNWWCVLFPSLCYPEDFDPDHPAFHFTLLNWLRGLFGGDAP